MEEKKLQLSSPFAPRERIYPDYVVREEDIVEYERYEALVKANADDDADFVTEERVREKSRLNRADFIQQFSDEVGIQNILKKVALSGDPSALNQINRPGMPIDQDDAEKREIIQDFTPLVGEEGAALVGDRARELFGKLPKELVKGRSYNEFVSTITNDEVNQFLADLKAGGNSNEQ